MGLFSDEIRVPVLTLQPHIHFRVRIEASTLNNTIFEPQEEKHCGYEEKKLLFKSSTTA